MSDFDAVLERLLTDPAFKAVLAADPQRALAGYHLATDEVALLQAQVADDAGTGDRTVELRTSKASLFGMLSPLAGLGAPLLDAGSGLGTPSQGQGFGAAEASHYIGQPLPVAQEGFGTVQASELNSNFDETTGGLLGTNLSQFGANLDTMAGPEQAGMGTAAPEPVTDYKTRVDASGDGKWDEHVYVRRADGGIDIVVDENKDGHVDFIGHDFDRDGLIDEALVDHNKDGTLEARWIDVNGDGWLDKKAKP
jgi:hypothetical protein